MMAWALRTGSVLCVCLCGYVHIHTNSVPQDSNNLMILFFCVHTHNTIMCNTRFYIGWKWHTRLHMTAIILNTKLKFLIHYNTSNQTTRLLIWNKTSLVPETPLKSEGFSSRWTKTQPKHLLQNQSHKISQDNIYISNLSLQECQNMT